MTTAEPTRAELVEASDKLVRLWHSRAQVMPIVVVLGVATDQ
jgi:hypothetical protein